MFVKKTEYEKVVNELKALKAKHKVDYRAKYDKAKSDLEAYKKKDFVKENDKLKKDAELAEIQHRHELKKHELELKDLQKEASIEKAINTRELKLEKESFEKTKNNIVKEAKREAALEVKEEYVKIIDKLFLTMMAGNVNKKEMEDMRKAIASVGKKK